MKKTLFAIVLFGFSLTSFSQFETIIDKLPKKLKNEIIIYQNSDTSIFVFKVADYIKSIGGINFARIDSIYHKDYIKLKDTLNYAIKNQYLIIGNLFAKSNGRDYKIFPNNFVLMELFSSNKIILFQRTHDTFDKINYSCRKRQGFFYVIQKKTKTIFFEIGYKRRT